MPSSSPPGAAGSRSGSRISMVGFRSRSRIPEWESRRTICRGSSRGSSRPTRPTAGAREAWESVSPSPRSWSSCTAGPSASSSPGETGTIFTVFLPFGRDHIRPEVIERRQQFEETAIRRRSDDASDVPDRSASLAARQSMVAVVLTAGDYTDGLEPVPFVSGRRPRILLAEDNPEVREFIRTLLEPRFRGDGGRRRRCRPGRCSKPNHPIWWCRT